MPVEVLISIVKDWYEWLVSGLMHLLSNDPFRRTGLKEYSVILTTSFYDINQKILTKKKLFPKFQLILILRS